MAIGKTAIVTGAGTGIGKAVAIALLKAGWNTVFTGRRLSLLEEAVAAAGKTEAKGAGRSCDVTQPDEVDRLFDGVVKEFGRVDLLFNNAGRGFKATLIDEIAGRDLERGRGGQPDRLVPVCARCVSRHAQAEPAGRPHHQQRLGLGACAAARLGAVHGDQACHHRPDQDAGARRPAVQHRLRADRHRQCADRDGRADDSRRAAGQWHDRRRKRRWTSSTSRARCSTWPACRSTPTCCS